MSEKLFKDAYAILDDSSVLEEDRVDRIEGIVRELFPTLKSEEAERLVLDVMMAHHRGIDPSEAAISHKIGVGPTAQKRPVSKKQVYQPQPQSQPPQKQHQHQQPRPELTTASLKPFDQLRNIFGWENDDQDIERALAHNDFDIERTISMLAGEQSDLELSKEQAAARIVCKYYIAGNCARGSRCMYSHDGGMRLCRFWLHQRCSVGPMCMFRHEVPAEIYDKINEMESAQAPSSSSSATFDFLPNLQSLPKLGSKSAKTAPKAPITSNGGALQSGTAGTLKMRPINEVLSSHRGLATLATPRLVPWVAVDFGKNAEYCKLRKQASYHADQRNRLLQQSTDAWSKNNPAEAKNLSNQGRSHEEKMIELYREAAELLWEQRKLPGSEVWLDLHGLDLVDAVSELEEKLEELSKNKHDPRPLYLISGRGHFKAKSYADSMTQYVLIYLDTQGFKHKDFGVERTFGRITAIDPWSSLRKA